MSSSWLAQVIFALAMKAGWAGPVIVASLAIAAAFALFAVYLERYASALLTTALALAAFILTHPHLLVRPHVLALPLLVAWFIGLIDAADRKDAPSVVAADRAGAVGQSAWRLRAGAVADRSGRV